MEKKIARIFEDINGYYVCDEDGELDTRGTCHETKRAAMACAHLDFYTHAIGSGTYWGNCVKRIPKEIRSIWGENK